MILHFRKKNKAAEKEKFDQKREVFFQSEVGRKIGK